MFAKFKPAPAQHGPFDGNPIVQHYDIGRLVGSAGPELAWRIYDAVRRCDKKEASVFVFEKKMAEKLHKPRRKETVTEILRQSIKELERLKHPKLLLVIHPVEESSEILAFATEPIMASLANVLAYQEDRLQQGMPTSPKEYVFLDLEIKYGILQITEALSFLHYSAQLIHRNICPQSILINKRGTWKLAGLEFVEKTSEVDVLAPVSCNPWTSKVSKMAQPDLDFMAPEMQMAGQCSPLSDMFSLGLVICSLFIRGHSLIEAGHSSSNYAKQLDMLEENLSAVVEKVPRALQDPLQKLVSKEIKARPSAQLFSLIKYFSDPIVHTLQYLDVIQMKDATQKAHFYHNLKDMLHVIPKKLWFQHVFPCLRQEIQSQEVLAAALQPIITLVQESNTEEFQGILLPSIRSLFSSPKSIQATVTLLENLPILLEKTPKDDIRSDVLPMLYNAFDSATPQVQCAALQAVATIADHLEETAIRKMVLPRAKTVFGTNANIKVQLSVLSCLESIIDKLEKMTILDEVLPMLAEAKLQDPDVLLMTVSIYKLLLSNKKYGLTVNLLATRVLPSLIPQTVNPGLSLEQFTRLMEVLQEMMEQVDKNQRNKLKLDNLSLPVNEKTNLRHLHSADHVPTFEIGGMNKENKKASASVEDVVKRESNSGPSSPDSNFLRVSTAITGRRHSDNVLLVPHIQVNPSSPDGEGKPLGTGGFPMRRHSSVGPPDSKYVHRAPGIQPSVTPFAPMATPNFPQGRRFSCAVPPTGGSNILQQLGSNVVSALTGSSMSSRSYSLPIIVVVPPPPSTPCSAGNSRKPSDTSCPSPPATPSRGRPEPPFGLHGHQHCSVPNQADEHITVTQVESIRLCDVTAHAPRGPKRYLPRNI